MKEPCEKGVALHLGLESCANLPQGVCEALTGYDSLNRVSAIRHLQCEDTPAYHREAYTYNAASMRTRIDVEKASGGSMLMPDSHKLYKYDALLRLTEEHKRRAGDNVSLYRYAYNYDAAGNRTQLVNFTGATTQTTTYVYNNGNQLTNSQGPGLDDDILYGYDTNGNMISALDQGPYTGKHYNHNRENRLTGVEYDDGKDGLNPLATYTYDALGRRIMRTDPQGNKLRYWYDGLGILLTKEKLSGASAWRTKQVYTLKQAALGHIISERTNTAWNAQGAATAWTDKWFHFDLLGNTTGELNAYGSVITYIDMEAFGTVLSGSQNGYRLTTKGYEADAGLYYFNARWYNSNWAGFLQRAPLARWAENEYGFSNSCPVRFVDPDGRFWFDPPYNPSGEPWVEPPVWIPEGEPPSTFFSPPYECPHSNCEEGFEKCLAKANQTNADCQRAVPITCLALCFRASGPAFFQCYTACSIAGVVVCNLAYFDMKRACNVQYEQCKIRKR
jgi:RHS repeat-associated protein